MSEILKLVRVRAETGPYPAALIDLAGSQHVLDLSPVNSEPDLLSILSTPSRLSAVEELISWVRQNGAVSNGVPGLALLDEVELEPPVWPERIFCVGHNFRGHLPAGVTSAEEMPFPNIFIKTSNTIISPSDPVVIPMAAKEVDYEGELAVVVGKTASMVSRGSGQEYIAGYTIVNDVSARDWQRRTSQWALGKCFDGFCPIGPALVAVADFSTLEQFGIVTTRDDVVVQEVGLDKIVFGPAFLIEYLSQVTTLVPGDVIAMGTPSKNPEAAKNHRPLADGDWVDVSVGPVGTLRTYFANPQCWD